MDTDNDHAYKIMEYTPFSCSCSRTATPRSLPWATKRRSLSTPRGTFEPMKKSLMTTSFPSRTRRYPVCVGHPTAEGHSTDVCTLTRACSQRHICCSKVTFTKYIYSCILTLCLCVCLYVIIHFSNTNHLTWCTYCAQVQLKAARHNRVHVLALHMQLCEL